VTRHAHSSSVATSGVILIRLWYEGEDNGERVDRRVLARITARLDVESEETEVVAAQGVEDIAAAARKFVERFDNS